ncbi:hypothetical protein M5K25_010808 [Dendrobium thyrsiflorum]|uniref:CFA20 domain-containing protein n=1 Tax=Dendrobium thyrsiflorum TaxID=117978 RepID=A0ABD0V1J4_DENTH
MNGSGPFFLLKSKLGFILVWLAASSVTLAAGSLIHRRSFAFLVIFLRGGRALKSCEPKGKLAEELCLRTHFSLVSCLSCTVLGMQSFVLITFAVKFVVVSSGGCFSNLLLLLGRSKPLQIWDKEVVNGQIKRPHDEDIQSSVLEIAGSNVQSTYITCPADPAATLGIKLPFLVMIVKNMKKYFTFEIQVLDDKNVRRRFRASNYQSMTRVKPFICTMPLRLEDGWNNIQLNLTDLTRRAYGTNYVETLRVQVHANCRLRRIYFSDRLYSEEELPPEFKLYLPMQKV